MTLIRQRNGRLSERYKILATRYRQRGWDPPPLPTGGLEAMNVVQQMVARINGRTPTRIRVGKPVVYLDPAVARRGGQGGAR